MRIIVDANIVFSGILNSNGKIGDLLINSKKHFHFIAPYFLQSEIGKHYERLIKLSGLSLQRIKESEFQICKDITFVSEEIIKPGLWVIAENIVADIDPKDTHYVAYARHFRSKLWSGDKHLIKGLRKKGFPYIITTDELFDLKNKRFFE